MYLATGSAADLAQRSERRVLTARQDIHIKLSYIQRRLVIARKKSQIIFGIHERHISASLPHIQTQGHATYGN